MSLPLIRILPPTVKVYAPGGIFLGQANEYEMNDLRVRIREAKATGYLVVDETETPHVIDKDGRYETYPPCFDLMSDQLVKLL